MSKERPHDSDRMLQLLADRATVGVEAMDAAELDEWLATDPGVDADSLELAAAAIASTSHWYGLTSETLSSCSSSPRRITIRLAGAIM